MNANASKAGTVFIVRRYAHPALMAKNVRMNANATTTVRATKSLLSVRALEAGKGSSAICHASRASMVSDARRNAQKDI